MTHIGDTVALLGTPSGLEEIKRIWQAHGELHIPLKIKKAQFNVSCNIIEIFWKRVLYCFIKNLLNFYFQQFRDVCVQQILEISNLQHVDEVKRAWMKVFNHVFSLSFAISGAE